MSKHTDGHDVRYGTVGDEGLRYLTCWTCKKSGISVVQGGTSKHARWQFRQEALAFLETHPPQDGWVSGEDKSQPVKRLKDVRRWLK